MCVVYVCECGGSYVCLICERERGARCYVLALYYAHVMCFKIDGDSVIYVIMGNAISATNLYIVWVHSKNDDEQYNTHTRGECNKRKQ